MSPEWAKPEKYLTIRKSQVKLQTGQGRATGGSRGGSWLCCGCFISLLVMLLSGQRYCHCGGRTRTRLCCTYLLRCIFGQGRAHSGKRQLCQGPNGQCGNGSRACWGNWDWSRDWDSLSFCIVLAEEQLMLMMIHTQVRFGYSK